MKAWDDNFVTDTGTGRRKGQKHDPFPFFSLSPFNSTSLFVSFFLLTVNKSNLVPPKCESNKS